jgi:hypothetical protein
MSTEESPISNDSVPVDDTVSINAMLAKLPPSVDVVASSVLKTHGKSGWVYEPQMARLFIVSHAGRHLYIDTYAKVPNDRAARRLGDAHDEGYRQGLLGSRHKQHMVISYIEITRNEVETE